MKWKSSLIVLVAASLVLPLLAAAGPTGTAPATGSATAKAAPAGQAQPAAPAGQSHATPAPASATPAAKAPASGTPAAKAPASAMPAAHAAAPATQAHAAAGKMARPAASAKVDLNTATRDELMKVPGIGEAIADKIIAGRPYAQKSELLTKKLVNRGDYAKLVPYVVARRAK